MSRIKHGPCRVERMAGRILCLRAYNLPKGYVPGITCLSDEADIRFHKESEVLEAVGEVARKAKMSVDKALDKIYKSLEDRFGGEACISDIWVDKDEEHAITIEWLDKGDWEVRVCLEIDSWSNKLEYWDDVWTGVAAYLFNYECRERNGTRVCAYAVWPSKVESLISGLAGHLPDWR